MKAAADFRHEAALPEVAATRIAEMGVSAMRDELETWPKPGLVSHVDSGSHHDMTAAMFHASATAIGPFLGALATAGAAGAPMDKLRRSGMEAEAAMLHATGGINTHRGAIFGLGLLCAAAGCAWGVTKRGATLGDIVHRRWGEAIMRGPIPLRSHGTEVLLRYGAAGARAQAAAGFPAVFEVGLPALRLGRTMASGDEEAARVHSFFALMAVTEDTNLLHRGGAEGLLYAQGEASAFLRGGSVGRADWRGCASAIHRGFVTKRLSPGGCADLLTFSLFVDTFETLR